MLVCKHAEMGRKKKVQMLLGSNILEPSSKAKEVWHVKHLVNSINFCENNSLHISDTLFEMSVLRILVKTNFGMDVLWHSDDLKTWSSPSGCLCLSQLWPFFHMTCVGWMHTAFFAIATNHLFSPSQQGQKPLPREKVTGEVRVTHR